MSIKQFNGTYYPQEDRILFRFNTVERAEYRFWFTRRITLFILGATTHLLTTKLEAIHAPAVAQALTEFERDAVQGSVKPDGQPGSAQVYEVGLTYPIGVDPLLVTDVKCTLGQESQSGAAMDVLALDLSLPGGGNVNIKLSGATLHTMCTLLDQLRLKAHWGSPLSFSNPPAPPEAGNPDAPKISIH